MNMAWVLCPILLLVMIPGCESGSKMNSKEEVYHDILRGLAEFEGISEKSNLCTYNPDEFLEDELKGSVLDSCFLSKEHSTELAHALYGVILKNNYIPQGVLRQDYLKWTAKLRDKDGNFLISLAIETLNDSKPSDGERWTWLQQGYHSKVYLNVYDRRKTR